MQTNGRVTCNYMLLKDFPLCFFIWMFGHEHRIFTQTFIHIYVYILTNNQNKIHDANFPHQKNTNVNNTENLHE